MASFNIFVLLVVGIIALANAEPEPEAYYGDSGLGYYKSGYAGSNYLGSYKSSYPSSYLGYGSAYSGINRGYVNPGYSGIGYSRSSLYSSPSYVYSGFNNGVYGRRGFGYAY